MNETSLNISIRDVTKKYDQFYALKDVSLEINSGEFTMDGGFQIPSDQMKLGIEARVGAENVLYLNSTKLAEKFLGDAIFSNALVLGAAWQMGRLPLSKEAIHKAIELNGAAVDANKKAFEIGRWSVEYPQDAAEAIKPRQQVSTTYEEKIKFRYDRLVSHTDQAWADRWMAQVKAAEAAEQKIGAEGYAEATALGLFKLMSYKDEYEVARLHVENLHDQINDRFDNVQKVEFHLAPPIMGRKDSNGHPVKTTFGPWVLNVFKMLAKMKGLRGGALDVFGYSAERKGERQAIENQIKLLDEITKDLTRERFTTAVQLADLPLQIKGYGHVKDANAEAAAKRRAELLAEFRKGGAPVLQAAE